jgi:hypothetical protein
MDGGKPGLMTRLVSALRGEVTAENLEAYRRAGGVAYQELEGAESLRVKLAADGVPPRGTPPAEAGQLLCAWNGFVLQTLGEEMLDADYAADPRTVRFVPPVTAEQVLAFFGQVEQWVALARQAQSNPAHRVGQEIDLPAELPAWVEAEPCPPAHLRAMVAAARKIRAHAEAALADFARGSADDAQHNADLDRLRQLLAEASTAADYADGLLATEPDQALHEAIEERLHRALEAYYRLGQLAAMPRLLDEQPARRPLAPEPVDVTSIDPWCLTDPDTRHRWRKDRRARKAIEMLWQMDPDPAATARIQAEVDAAVADGSIDYATNSAGKRIGHYYCCPWAAVYRVRRRVVIGGKGLRPMQQFTYDVSAEGMAEGGPFVRDIKVGNFTPTDEVDYCDPESGHHDD